MKPVLVLDPKQLSERDRRTLHARELHARRPSARSSRKASSAAVRITIEVEGSEPFVLPQPLAAAVTEALAEVADGRKVYLTAAQDELTTQQVADLLGVSRPHVVQLLEAGEMPFRKVGSHRRIERVDFESYRQKMRRQQSEALDALAAEAQELGLGY